MKLSTIRHIFKARKAMNGEKQWYLSKSVWGSIIAILAGVVSAWGIDLTEAMQNDLADLIVRVVGVGATGYALWGRFVAEDKLV